MENRYDYLVLGSGPAGHGSAIRAAELGLKTACVEKHSSMFGGVCLNEGCVPAKSLYHDASLLQSVRKNRKLLDIGSGKPVGVNLPAMVKRSKKVSAQLAGGLSFLFKKNSIDIFYGEGVFCGNNAISVKKDDGSEVELEGENILIATGSAPRALKDTPFDGKRVISSREAIALEKVPANILIVGAGAIGVEFADYFNNLGSKVTLVEMEEEILPLEDSDIARRLRSLLNKNGIEIMTGKTTADVDVSSYEKVLVSIGREPNSGGIGLEKTGVELDGKGFIKVDKCMRSSVKNIFAAGDIAGPPMLAHSALFEGELAAESAAGRKPGPIDPECVPNAVYSGIKAASVGLNEKQLKEKGGEYRTAKYLFKANGRAVAEDEAEGFIKVISDKAAKKILGAHIVGCRADEIVHEFVLAKRMGLGPEDIARTIHAHPTFSEAAGEACRELLRSQNAA